MKHSALYPSPQICVNRTSRAAVGLIQHYTMIELDDDSILVDLSPPHNTCCMIMGVTKWPYLFMKYGKCQDVLPVDSDSVDCGECCVKLHYDFCVYEAKQGEIHQQSRKVSGCVQDIRVKYPTLLLVLVSAIWAVNLCREAIFPDIFSFWSRPVGF